MSPSFFPSLDDGLSTQFQPAQSRRRLIPAINRNNVEARLSRRRRPRGRSGRVCRAGPHAHRSVPTSTLPHSRCSSSNLSLTCKAEAIETVLPTPNCFQTVYCTNGITQNCVPTADGVAWCQLVSSGTNQEECIQCVETNCRSTFCQHLKPGSG